MKLPLRLIVASIFMIFGLAPTAWADLGLSGMDVGSGNQVASNDSGGTQASNSGTSDPGPDPDSASSRAQARNQSAAAAPGDPTAEQLIDIPPLIGTGAVSAPITTTTGQIASQNNTLNDANLSGLRLLSPNDSHDDNSFRDDHHVTTTTTTSTSYDHSFNDRSFNNFASFNTSTFSVDPSRRLAVAGQLPTTGSMNHTLSLLACAIFLMVFGLNLNYAGWTGTWNQGLHNALAYAASKRPLKHTPWKWTWAYYYWTGLVGAPIWQRISIRHKGIAGF